MIGFCRQVGFTKTEEMRAQVGSHHPHPPLSRSTSSHLHVLVPTLPQSPVVAQLSPGLVYHCSKTKGTCLCMYIYVLSSLMMKSTSFATVAVLQPDY